MHLPLLSFGTYNFTVYWGDGQNNTITSWNQVTVTHTYSSSGNYTIAINGTIKGWEFNNGGDKLKIIEISQWGTLNLGNTGYYFYGASNLLLSATDAPNLTGTTTLNEAFENCVDLGSTGSLNSWDVSAVKGMDSMFYYATSFNQPITSWDVSAVIDMGYMFYQATSFNQPISSWNVSAATYMGYMFYQATSFNQPIGSWNVSAANSMYSMFYQASSFNQPIGLWNVSKVTDMRYMFYGAFHFNQPINLWDVSHVTVMGYMFYNDGSFPGPMFFNQPIGSWNVTKTDVTQMFYRDNLSIANYDNLLIGWSKLKLAPGLTFDTGYSKYSDKSAYARNYIIAHFTWSISDGGPMSMTLPGAPQILQSLSSSSFTFLSWNVPNNDGGNSIDSYNIYSSQTSGSGYSFLTKVNGSILFYNYTTIDSSHTYYFIVRAVNYIGEGPASNEVNSLPTLFPVTTTITQTSTTTLTQTSNITQTSTITQTVTDNNGQTITKTITNQGSTTETATSTKILTSITTLMSQITDTLTKTTQGFEITFFVLGMFGILVIRRRRT